MTRMKLTALLATAQFRRTISTVTLVMISGDSLKGKAAGSAKAAGRRIRGNSVPLAAEFVRIRGAVNAAAQNGVSVRPWRLGGAASRRPRPHDDRGESA